MKKKILASLLAAALVLGLMPPVSAQATESSEETIATDIKGGTYTDETALAEESYEYTVTGSDGSEETIVVAAEAGNTGNSLINTGNGTGYQKTSASELTSGTYLIIGAHDTDAGWAVTPETDLPWNKEYENTFQNTDFIDGEYTALEWEFTTSGTNYTIKKKQGTSQYMEVTNADSANKGAVTLKNHLLDSRIHKMQITAGHYPNSVYIWDTDASGGLNRRGEEYVGTWNDSDSGSSFYLYKKVDAQASGWKLDLSGLKALHDQSGHYTESNYTQDTWNAMQVAKNEANAIVSKENTIYSTESEGNTELAKANIAYNTLWNAISGLTPNVNKNEDGTVADTQVAVPSILWQRTLEYNYNSNELGGLVNNVSHIDPNDSTWSKIQWNWSQVAGLTTDPRMTIWDYNTENQYSDKSPVNNVVAATWAKGTNDWTKSTVRKFSGEFIWPEGYDLDDTAKLVSVNDENYQNIYNEINNDAELQERYGDATVMPINDDMYVLIYKDGDTITADNYMDHMVYWTGTSGKGKWSSSNNRTDDWERSIPPTYKDKNALPAYYGVMPNKQDVNYQDGFIYNGTGITQMSHTDNWYTMADTSAIMSTLSTLYSKESLDGQKMHIDIYCFNNSADGGMDQLELKMVKKKATSTTVKVQYYLNSVDTNNFLGETQETDVADRTEMTLKPGTNVNELNHMRAKAITAAGGNVTVSDGVQQNPIPYIVQVGKNNVINVVYTTETKKSTSYTYDFGVKNVYQHQLQEESATGVTLKNAPVGMSVDSVEKGSCQITYTPDNALRKTASAILNVTYTANGETFTYQETVYVVPASNVLYEENFFMSDKSSGWNQTGTIDGISVADNETTVYGYSDAYKASKGESGTYSATVYPSGSTEGPVSTGSLKTTFSGTGVDLIGTCGPNTGTLAVRINDESGNFVKAYIVDTAFEDANYETIYQVPFLHCQGLANATYQMEIRGSYIDYGASKPASTMSLNEEAGGVSGDAVSQIYDLLYDMGLTDADIDQVEFVSVEDNASIAAYAAEEGSEEAAEPKAAPDSMTLEIDGFRVYGTTDNNAYAETEKNLVYDNVLDCINGDNLVAYIEGKENDTYEVTAYEAAGGPQYEVYLSKQNTALGLKAGGSKVVQVSLRSVTGDKIQVQINGKYPVEISSPTEMYYEVPAREDGLVSVQMLSEKGLLAIGNVKHDGTMTAVTEADYPALFAMLAGDAQTPEEPEDDAFVPERFDVSMSVENRRKKKEVTITVKASKDVDYITVNGKKVKEKKRGIFGIFDYIFDKIMGKEESNNVRKFVFEKKYSAKEFEGVTHEIIAYDKDGLASVPMIAEEVTGK